MSLLFDQNLSRQLPMLLAADVVAEVQGDRTMSHGL